MKALKVFEKFVEESDPIKDMGIGIFTKRKFDTTNEATNYMIKILPVILKTERIPTDIVKNTNIYWGDWFNEKYGKKIINYIREYIQIDDYTDFFNIHDTQEELHKKLVRKGYRIQ